MDKLIKQVEKEFEEQFGKWDSNHCMVGYKKAIFFLKQAVNKAYKEGQKCIHDNCNICEINKAERKLNKVAKKYYSKKT